MIKEFVPYELAVKLKELGFDEPCFGNWQDMKEETPWFSKSYADNQNQYYGQLCSAPTFSQAFRWFREKYNMKPCFDWHPTEEYRYCIYYSINTYFEQCDFLTHEEAELACLRKLIELVKND